jgi:nitrous oxidase accessory protein NosD
MLTPRSHPVWIALVALVAAMATVCADAMAGPARRDRPQAAERSRQALIVPTHYPTVQSAVDAAEPGRTIRLLPGTYMEQIVLRKDVTLVGAGKDTTILRAPITLANGQLGSASIVEVANGARVSMSRLAVQGPGAHSCARGPSLKWGIRVHSRAHLSLGFAAVREIHGTPLAFCPGNGTAIAVGQAEPGSLPASLTVHHSEITNYQSTGILVLGAGSWAEITHNRIVGPGHGAGVPTDGVELVAGAIGTIARNVISQNICPANLPQNCGPDFFTQFQHAGIVAGGNGPGTVIVDNVLIGNQVGMFLAEADEISGNTMLDNEFFGLALIGLSDGAFTVHGGAIKGGGGGLWLTPVAMDMAVVLERVRFAGLGGPQVQMLEGAAFKATVVTKR